MPKITINEKDLTSGGAYLASENVVYIPGFSTENDVAGEPVLCKTVGEFTQHFGATPLLLNDKDDKSYIMAYELLKLGMYVLYEVPATALGEQTAVENVNEMENALGQKGFWTRLTDRGKYDIRFITSGAYAKDNIEIITEMLATAQTRGDAIALIDHASVLTEKQEVQEYFDEIGADVNSKYGAGFTPWIYINSDAYNADAPDKLMPGTFAYLASFALSVQTNPSWMAVAGAVRGRIPKITAPFTSIQYGELEANDLQTREKGEIAVNPICNINPYGYIIWGNRTLSPVGAGTTAQNDLVATNFLNIRNLISSIKKTLFVASRGLTFEQNSDILWINFKAQITPLLDKMTTGNGIADYRLIKQKADKKATLKATIRIVPIEAVEDFDLTVEMSDSTESVTEQ